jgi:cytochrome d ubiquinol oxidase subunit I
LLLPQYLHMVAAAYMTAGFVVASVYAVGLLRGRRDRYHRLGFLVPFVVAAIVAPLQFVIGDALARAVFQQQPTKFAAIEIVWKTGPDQAEYIYGRLHPDGTVTGGVKIPDLDSFLAGFSRTTVVHGLSETSASNRPTTREANIAHFAFDTMVNIAMLLALLAVWFAIALIRWRDIPRSRWFYRAASVAGVLSVVALECGWVTAEVGRQPWVVYEQMKVAQAVTDISAGPIWTSFVVVVVVYALVAWAFIGLLLRLKVRWRQADDESALAQKDAPPAPERERVSS